MWDEFLVAMVRNLTNVDESLYCDNDLIQKILTAINIMQIEIEFEVDYVADIVGMTLTPDPYTSDPVDYSFMALAALKTACMIEMAEASRATSEGVQLVQDNDFKIQTGGTAGKDKLEAVKHNWCAKYEKAKDDYILSLNSGVTAKAVISPFKYTDYATYFRRGTWQ